MRATRQNSIQWLRAIAALEVVLWHTDLATKHFSTATISSLDWYRPIGGIGVELFFVISGYVMYLNAPTYKTGMAFMWARIARIVPMYWLFTSMVVVVFWFNPDWRLGNFKMDLPTLFNSYFIVPQIDYPILSVGWSLEHEMIFYAMLALFIGAFGAVPHFSAALVPAIAGVLGLLLGTGQPHPPVWDFHLLSPYMLCFAFGWALCFAKSVGRASTFLTVGISAAVATVVFFYSDPLGQHLLFRMVLATVIFMAALRMGDLLQIDNVVNRTASAIGDASYSLYLSHWLVLSGIGKSLKVFQLQPWFDLPIRLAGIMACIALALCVFRYIENPIDRWLRPRGQGRRSAPLMPQVGNASDDVDIRVPAVSLEMHRLTAHSYASSGPEMGNSFASVQDGPDRLR